MVGRIRLTDRQRWQVVTRLDVGQRQIDIAARFGVSQSVVSRLYDRYRQTGEVAERPGRGRTRVTSARNDRYFVNQTLRSRTLSALKLRQQLRNMRNVNVSVQTVRNRLNDSNLNARRPLKARPLTPRHRRAREQWARTHFRWNRQQWSTVLFTDESLFHLSRADGRIRVWRRTKERYAQCNIVRRRKCYGVGRHLP